GPATIEKLPDLAFTVPDGYSIKDDETMGALDAHAFLARNGIDANAPEGAWVGDRLQVFGRATPAPASTVVLWRLRFATAASAQSVASAATFMMVGAKARLSDDGRGVDILLAETNEEIAPFASALGFP